MDDFHKVLRKFWGYEEFRSVQLDIIQNIYNGRDTLGLLPTGGGKSICFQVPALLMNGVCIVITPLIALMKDQVQNLIKHGISAVSVSSELNNFQLTDILDNCCFGLYKFLYLSPERLHTDLFISKLRHMRICMLVVDEAHCISQWGYDFRPNYLAISMIRQYIPKVPVLALTATATPAVASDIQKQLNFSSENLIRTSFERPNISYNTLKTSNKLQSILQLITEHNGTAIIYCSIRDDCSKVSHMLNQNGITSDFYHAHRSALEKDYVLNAWMHDEIHVVVCTNAFGMGIDKPDVRLVVHMSPPDTLEAYFQEAGRAGRDGLPSTSVLLWDERDIKRLTLLPSRTYPTRDNIRSVYDSINNYFQIGINSGEGVFRKFDYHDFCHKFHFSYDLVTSSLKLLDRAGYFRFIQNEDMPAKVKILKDSVLFDDLAERFPLEYAISVTLMRQYEGIFTEYREINLERISSSLSLRTVDIDRSLSHLDKMNYLSYSPHDIYDTIRWIQPRTLPKEVIIPRSILDDRKANMERKTSAVIHFCENTDVCTSRLLLHYFGEKHTRNCGHCNVCNNNKRFF